MTGCCCERESCSACSSGCAKDSSSPIRNLKRQRNDTKPLAAWLADADDAMLRALAIYLQGSTALGTTVKPIIRNEHDVDLVAHNPSISGSTAPGIVKKVIGDRLKLNGRYAPILEEMPRCWRLNYANEFHLDITPSIINPTCVHGGELVPDKKVREWCASNPKGYRVPLRIPRQPPATPAVA